MYVVSCYHLFEILEMVHVEVTTTSCRNVVFVTLAQCLNMVLVFECLKPSNILFPWTNIFCFRHHGDDVDLIPLQEMKVGQLSCVRSGALPREVFNRIAARAGEQWTQNLVEKEGWKTTTTGIGKTEDFLFFWRFWIFWGSGGWSFLMAKEAERNAI